MGNSKSKPSSATQEDADDVWMPTTTDVDETKLKKLLRENTLINFVRRGLPAEVHRAIAEPSHFGFDVAIHLRLLAIWGSTPSNRSLQRSIAEQLGIIDDGDTRKLLRKSDDEDDVDGYKGVKEEEEEQAGEVEEVAKRIYRRLGNINYLVVLENAPDKSWVQWKKLGIPVPSDLGAGRMIISSFQKEDADILSARTKRRAQRYVKRERSASRNLYTLGGEVATYLGKMLGITITAGDVVKSIVYWWLFKPFVSVPVEALVDSWVSSVALLLPSSPDHSSSSSPPSAGGGGGGETTVQPRLGLLGVGKALLEELCRHYLLNTRKQEDDGVWYRQPLDQRHPLIKSGALAFSFSWMGVSLEREEVLLLRGDGKVVAALDLNHTASAFLTDYDDDPKSKRSKGFRLKFYSMEDDMKYWCETLKIFDDREQEAEVLIEGLTMLNYVNPQGSGHVDAANTQQPEGGDDLQHQNVNMIPDDLFKRTPNLMVLDLSNTSISSLPESLFCCLRNLRVLLLQGCKHLEALVAPASASAASAQAADSPSRLHSMWKLENLRIIRLTHTKLDGFLPEELFKDTGMLRVLDLSHNQSIKSLPVSLSQSLPTLEEIHLNGCKSLERVDFWQGHPMPRLRVLSLSDSPVISRLSLRGCSRLEAIDLSNLGQLEVLDLSGTGIQELPVAVLNLPRLRRLELLGVQRLRRFPWRETQRLPEELNLDTCTCGFLSSTTGTGPVSPRKEVEASSPTSGHRKSSPHISLFASDPRVLDQACRVDRCRSLKESIEFIREVVPHFDVCISPCDHHRPQAEVRRRRRRLKAVRAKGHSTTTIPPFAYGGVPLATTMGDTVIIGTTVRDDDRLDRHVDVCGGGGRFLDGARLFLGSADSVTLRDHHYDTPHLTGLLPDDNSWTWSLRMCRLERCHSTGRVFHHPHRFPLLERLWVSKLPSLTAAWRSDLDYEGHHDALEKLRYVHLEYCPRLVTVFPGGTIHLPHLERLLVKSCPRLRHVFAPASHKLEPQAHLNSLATMELIHLPSLESIALPGDGVIRSSASWQLKVRGCWRLRQLPTFMVMVSPPDPDQMDASSYSSSSSPVRVEIDGEPLWWKNLQVMNNTTVTAVLKPSEANPRGRKTII